MQTAIDQHREATLQTPTPAPRVPEPWVPETQLGTWFINTDVWVKYVLRPAIRYLKALAGGRLPSAPVLLDLACGRGKAVAPLSEAFGPRRIIAFDVDATEVARAERDFAEARSLKPSCPVRFGHCGVTKLDLEDASVDIVFCHQSFHHFIDQDAALEELRRVLRPGGVLLLSESLRAFIYTRRIRYLFRHPMEVQKTAPEYLNLFARAGFDRQSYKTSVVWWSRRDMGLFERLGAAPSRNAEDTLLNLAAFRT